jgi:hypothetical protein
LRHDAIDIRPVVDRLNAATVRSAVDQVIAEAGTADDDTIGSTNRGLLDSPGGEQNPRGGCGGIDRRSGCKHEVLHPEDEPLPHGAGEHGGVRRRQKGRNDADDHVG